MPTYDYRCVKCKKKFEMFQRITAAPLKKCPKCNGKVERMIGGGLGLIFKGSGFYTTDYKNSRSEPSAKEPKPKDTPAKKNGSTSSP